MKHITIVQNTENDSSLKEKVNSWITQHETEILNIINIEYNENNYMYIATITYEERNQ